MNNKDCLICVYEEVCQDRKRDETITDCCVPEAPLRAKQRAALRLGGVEAFMRITAEYCNAVKEKSKYWKQEKTKGK